MKKNCIKNTCKIFPVHFTSNSEKKIVEITCKFPPNFKLQSDFFPHFLRKIRKLENFTHLYIVNFKCAKFQKN